MLATDTRYIENSIALHDLMGIDDPSAPIDDPSDGFVRRTPRSMWASDDLDTYGQRQYPRLPALRRAYIDPNTAKQVWAIVFDIDRSGSAFDWEDRNLPRPNWVAQNPENGHVHFGYILDRPVSRTSASRLKPLRYLASVQAALSREFDADPSYGHRLTKNPIHARWRTLWEREAPYDLGELREYLEKRGNKKLPTTFEAEEAIGLGRNVTVFDGLRKWAYRARLKYNAFGLWEDACIRMAQSFNSFASPLSTQELRHIARSVAKWTWKHFSHAKFAEIQSYRGKTSGKKRLEKAKAMAAQALHEFDL